MRQGQHGGWKDCSGAPESSLSSSALLAPCIGTPNPGAADGGPLGSRLVTGRWLFGGSAALQSWKGRRGA